MSTEQRWKAREIEILHLLAEGLTNSEIGRRLHLAPDTIRWYNKRIFEKLGAGSRHQAVRFAQDLGILNRPAVPILPSPIRYTRNGQVHLAYQTIGSGPVDLLFIHGFLSHLELAWEQPDYSRFFETLARSARVILFDKRGVGLSDRNHGSPSIEDTIEDAIAVLDAAGSRRAFVMGTSEGGAAAVLLAAVHPERVDGLILYATTPRITRDGDGPEWAARPENFHAWIDALQESWGSPAALESFAPSVARDERFRAWWSRILRAASSPAGIRTVLENLGQVDIRSLLPQVRVRTTVIHKQGDRMVNLSAGRFLAAQIPLAEFVELAGQDHIYFVDSAALIAAVQRFLSAEPAPTRVETWIATILTAAAAIDGPLAGSILADIGGFRPRHTFLAGNRVCALFESPSQAIGCAQHLRGRERDGQPRISLHVGECGLADGQPRPDVLAQSIAAASAAEPGEILVTRTLKDILAGSAVQISSRSGPSSDALEHAPVVYFVV